MIAGAPVKPPVVIKQSHEALWDAFQNNGAEVIDALIEAYMPLAHRALERISMRLPSHIAVDDLLQAALVGLYKAVLDFDSTRGVPFEGYAYPRIRGAILDELRSCDSLSRSKRKRVDQVEQVISEWMKEYGEMPAEEEIAAELGMSIAEFNQLMDEAKPLCSLDAGGVDMKPLHETLADPNGASEEGAHRHDLQRLLRIGFSKLDQREQKILYLYYFEELRLSEIAILFDLTEARISQIHALSVVRLRAVLLDQFPSEFAA
ncbi:sigma-70 family RNA polymerase sigma factor [Pontiella agarivorans]|uniref:FliA/WhiG family RNA polymerase sigma factor n=1 Tax=Pontiella agarivorans TaxID=3038953 RepID=A0ABU5MT09_9BACT|nr:FliA/WhiG family RNA polymerase sigma factor [Pontiella agarivorans]MDZ8117272.1 FliA/WhiG family RNA polymerase sigma factor [Pontiella agarivorans]